MKRQLKTVLMISVSLLLCLLLRFFVVPTLLLSCPAPICSDIFVGLLIPHDNQSGLTLAATEWAHLAPLPKSKRDFIISREGFLFEWSLTASFRASSEDIKNWINASPGIKESKPEPIDLWQRYYVVDNPGGGATDVIITVDDNNQSVTIQIFWG